jgi:hypothetical protein
MILLFIFRTLVLCSAPFPLALTAVACYLVMMACLLKALLLADLLLQYLDRRASEFNDPAAPETEKMIMMLAAIDHLVFHSPVRALGLLDDPAGLKDTQSPVNRGPGRMRSLLPALLVKLLCLEMLLLAQNLMQDHPSSPGQAQSPVMQIALKQAIRLFLG